MAEQAVPDDEKTVRRLDGRHRLRNKRPLPAGCTTPDKTAVPGGRAGLLPAGCAAPGRQNRPRAWNFPPLRGNND